MCIRDRLRAEYHLDETNFAVSYYNTVTGEEYNWNETAMFTAASTFKLPLNLYYYELQNEGKISGDTVQMCIRDRNVWKSP